MTADLDPSGFADFFREVNDCEPFPWQRRLAEQVLIEGRWPDVLELPTGSGKTAVLEIALYCLATAPRLFPRRVVMVVDRRVVVDQAALHARALCQRMSAATGSNALRVANALRALWTDDLGSAPFETTVLRGGMPRDDAWARRPDRPVLAVSTVDQVGSRLLFRGYGVSSRMTSVHAGLLGHDTLFLLDEVHLSVPFAQTLLAVRDRWRGFHSAALPDRWGVVRLSATPGAVSGDERRFGTADAAWAEDAAHPVLQRRLRATKQATLKEVGTTAPKKPEAELVAVHLLARHAAEEALRLLRDGSAAVGVVLNRVAGARECARVLAQADPTLDVQLLTGRMRPLERDEIVAGLLPRIAAGRAAPAAIGDLRPVVVVATQCIEAGADLDFDALVTECASLDSLRQRFGRLDRLGRRGHSQAVVLVRSDQVSDSARPDPIYGESLRCTWRWLKADTGGCDFGIEVLDSKLRAVDQAPMLAPKADAPILLPAHLDLLSQTHPRPFPDPDIAALLHGPERGEPELQVVWRADLDESMFEAGASTLDGALDRLVACPPAAGEALSLPISAVRGWLTDTAEPLLADVSAAGGGEPANGKSGGGPGRAALLWAGEDSRVVAASDLKAGMTLIVPASRGGIAQGNWMPGSAAPVTDLGDLVQWQARGRATLRLHDATLPGPLSALRPCLRWNDDEDGPGFRTKVNEALEQAMHTAVPPPWCDVVAALSRRCRIVRHRDGTVTLLAPPGRDEAVSTEDDNASFTDAEVTLSRHAGDVRRWAELFVARLDLPHELSADIVLAAWLHDAGKADPRFQCWLSGGSAVRAASQEALLAKSAQSARDRAANEHARKLSGYPSGYRHELLSMAMLQAAPHLLSRASDPDLVLHLVAAHHGWCRPLAPPVDDPEAIAVSCRIEDGPNGMAETLQASTRHGFARLDAGVPDRFWQLTERYGWWGLAWLESILRLADHRASAQGRPASTEDA